MSVRPLPVRKYSFFLNYIALFRYLTHPSPGSIELRPRSAIGDRTPLSLIHLPRQQAEVPNSALSLENWIVFG
jgi:hypothetical protein